MSVSPLTAKNTAPSSHNVVWEPLYLFRAQWKDGVSIRSSFETTVKEAQSGAEQRVGLRNAPFRTSKVTLCGLSLEDTAKLRILATRRGKARSLFPLHSDVSPVLSDSPVTGATIPCSTLYRRFFPGKRIAVLHAGNSTCPSFEIGEVESLTSNSITLTQEVTTSVPVGSLVFPLMETDLHPKQTGKLITNHVTSMSLESREYIGRTQLPASIEANTIPSGFSTFDGLPVLVGRENWVNDISCQLVRGGDSTPSGLTSLFDPTGTHPYMSFDLEFTSDRRQRAWEILQLFESRRGRLYPFWLVSPCDDISLHSVLTTSSIKVNAIGELIDWDHYSTIAVKMTNGDVHLRHIDTVTRTDGLDTLTLTESIPGLTTSGVSELSLVFRVRFDKDELEEKWITTECMKCALPVKEVEKEQSISIENYAQTTSIEYSNVFLQCATPEEGTLSCEDCPPTLSLRYVWSLPMFTYLDKTTLGEILTCSSPTSGDVEWDGKFTRDWDLSENRLYRLPDLAEGQTGWKIGNQALDFTKSGIYWLEPSQRVHYKDCLELRIFCRGQTSLPIKTLYGDTCSLRQPTLYCWYNPDLDPVWLIIELGGITGNTECAFFDRLVSPDSIQGTYLVTWDATANDFKGEADQEGNFSSWDQIGCTGNLVNSVDITTINLLTKLNGEISSAVWCCGSAVPGNFLDTCFFGTFGSLRRGEVATNNDVGMYFSGGYARIIGIGYA